MRSFVIGVLLLTLDPASSQTIQVCADKPVDNGCGTFTWPDGAKYVGDFRGGYPSGASTIYQPDGSKMVETLSSSTETGSKYTFTASNGLVTSGAVVGPAKDIHRPHPPMRFPFWRSILGDQGSVEILAMVEPDGRVTDAAVYLSSGSKSFDEAAIEGVLQWRYLPATIAGKAIRYPTLIHVDFAQAG